MISKRWLNWRKKYYYDRLEAKRAVTFFETQIQHIDGEHAGKLFHLERWQRRMVRRIYGWFRRSDGTRKHRRVLLFIPKKNGKSALGGGFALYQLLADREQGASVVSAASDTEQAELVFKFAKENVARNPTFRKLIGKTFRRSIVVHDTASVYKALSSAAGTKHGPNHSCVLIDELHALPNRELVDTLVAGVVARRQPLIIYMTTAGHDLNTICGEVYEWAKKVRDGIVEDDEFLPMIFEPDKTDDWRDPKTWYKANPNLGITIKESALAADCARAMELPSEENKFKRLHLNIWTEQDVRWIPMEKWRTCGEPFPTRHPKRSPDELFLESDLDGMPCYGGLDLASRVDIAAFVLLFPLSADLYYIIPRFWVPMESALERQLKGQGDYFNWIKAGHMVGTPGNDIDYSFIRADIKKASKQFKIREIGYDPWNANQLTHQLNDEDGITMVETRQGYATLSSPSKEFEARIAANKFKHGGNPVLNWMASNVCTQEDPAGNIKPVRPKNRNLKIDGIIATVISLARIMVDDKRRVSVYDTRGVLSLG